jgi:hypothetical protein
MFFCMVPVFTRLALKPIVLLLSFSSSVPSLIIYFFIFNFLFHSSFSPCVFSLYLSLCLSPLRAVIFFRHYSKIFLLRHRRTRGKEFTVHTVYILIYSDVRILIINTYTNDKTQNSVTFIQTPTCFDALVGHLQAETTCKNTRKLKTVLMSF